MIIRLFMPLLMLVVLVCSQTWARADVLIIGDAAGASVMASSGLTSGINDAGTHDGCCHGGLLADTPMAHTCSIDCSFIVDIGLGSDRETRIKVLHFDMKRMFAYAEKLDLRPPIVSA